MSEATKQLQREHSAKSLTAKIRAAYERLRVGSPEEVAKALGLSIHIVRPRISELLSNNTLVDNGRRKKNALGRRVRVYEWNDALPKHEGKGMELRVSDISAESPEMDEKQFKELVEDIRQRGQLVPIWIYGDEVIDGRKRLKACEIIGIEPKVVRAAADTDRKALSYSLNVLRTHYTPGQRSMFLTRLQILKRGHVKSQINQDVGMVGKVADHPITTVEAARIGGVSERSVRAARRVKLYAVPKVVEAVESGDLSIKAALQIADFKPDEQLEVLRDRVRYRAPEAGSVSRRTRVGKNALRDRIVRGIDQLENASEMLTRFFTEEDARNSEHLAEWIEKLRKVRKQLWKIIHAKK